MKNLFTSESVSSGHPDKLCDQISDAVLDACLEKDPESRVACETFASTSLVLVGGEITTNAYVDIQQIVKDVVKDIGYTNSEFGLDYKSMAIQNMIHSQSQDISQGVSGEGTYKGEQGAGDQGMMFGYATNETPEYMPLPIMLAHKLMQRAESIRINDSPLRPDAKSQVTIEYDDNGKPRRIDTVVISHQHHPDIEHAELKRYIIDNIITPVLKPLDLIDLNTAIFVNPTGRFVIGGPYGDTGLTGRKIIVDTYGGMGRHGGGAFSGKDPSKVDRSAAYMARYIAKNIVAANLADKCEVQLAYAIGVPFPVSIMLDCFGTEKINKYDIINAINANFDMSPAGIIKTFDLKRPIYRQTATYGHFGKPNLPWEQLDKVEILQKLM